ncbi:ATP-dependent helicase [Corynebacterium alimapuense]|uniref:ATP-dependent helicase n=1 Tax=Corynebacterium alimapuense TaxID=1576874 RepID=A0A3M8K934_9CORY|nr:ATP-dependent helicase [Corynebacterium alimapuense]
MNALHPVIIHHIVSTLRWPGLRPLQEQAVAPLISGEDAILLAPTAGGKTEAAAFPILSRMTTEEWSGVSVLYLCPIKALLNNLEPRLAEYAAWLGRRVAVWHGDIGQSARRRIIADPPDILLTTPESLEAIMVSRGVDAASFLGSINTVIIDEVHAFAGDDRGWHLSAVLSRVESFTGHQLQRIGMSATVGNPQALLSWLQGGRADRPGRVLSPEVTPGSLVQAEITVDYVGSISSASLLISKLHQGEKRLAFVDSRRMAEELGTALHERGVRVYLSHSSLSADERRRAEDAFANDRDCIIVATSTLELGIDVGDLDRVIQIGTPGTVSSFLQRLGRTGRRSGSSRNCLLITIDDEDGLIHTLGLLQAWSRGFVEEVTAPPLPRHLAAQQFLAAALSDGTINLGTWHRLWESTPLMSRDVLGIDPEEILNHLISSGMLETDGGQAFIGIEAERAFGHRHFMELLSAFTTPPVFTVTDGRYDIGTVELRTMLSASNSGSPGPAAPMTMSLAGRYWKVVSVDWRRRRLVVERADTGAITRWGSVSRGFGAEVTSGMLKVLLGEDPAGVVMTRRAADLLGHLRDEYAELTPTHGFHYLPATSDTAYGHLWTWAGTVANQQLVADLSSQLGEELAPQRQRIRHDRIFVHYGVPESELRERIRLANNLPSGQRPLPEVNEDALDELKFSQALPAQWAMQVLETRLVTP